MAFQSSIMMCVGYQCKFIDWDQTNNEQHCNLLVADSPNAKTDFSKKKEVEAGDIASCFKDNATPIKDNGMLFMFAIGHDKEVDISIEWIPMMHRCKVESYSNDKLTDIEYKAISSIQCFEEVLTTARFVAGVYKLLPIPEDSTN